MQTIPTRSPQEWAAFNSRFNALLSWAPVLCFWIVVGGSVYGVQKSLEEQFPGIGIWIAFAVAFVIQKINAVAVHFSTRAIAALVIGQGTLRQNQHQRVESIDYLIGVLCATFTIGICYFDFRANHHASDVMAEKIVAKPPTETVDSRDHQKAVAIAEKGVAAAKAAEAAERSAHEARVEKQYAKKEQALRKRLAHISKVQEQWARNEAKNINAQLANMEKAKQAEKRNFVPSGKVAEATGQLGQVASLTASQLNLLQMKADSTNIKRITKYESKTEGFALAFFLVYIIAMLFWHLCHGIKMYRALKYDEQQPDSGNAVAAIAETIRNGMNNMLWKAQAGIAVWMPEDELTSMTRTDLLAKTNSQICADVYQTILQNPGINELLVYTRLRDKYDVMDMRHALRLLKSSKLAFENSGTWTADANQASFFFGASHNRAA